MIFIFSKSEHEPSTEHVIDWLLFQNIEFKRINGSELLSVDSSMLYNDTLSKNDTVWFRRWYNGGEVLKILSDANLESSNLVNIYKHLFSDLNILTNSFFRKFKHCNWLTHPKELAYDKLEVLETAVKCGLDVPNTIVSTSKNNVIAFRNNNDRIITKILSDGPPTLIHQKHFIMSYTKEITDEVLNLLPEKFFPSLFQKLIEKEYEIRTFFLKEKFFSMAIFSQNDRQTELDFRDYNHKKPNRNVPYKLPICIESKLRSLIKHLNLTTGSIDLIKGKDEKYYFLENNPVGQFGMTSHPCNYYLEKEIALYLNNKK